ncbi:hypothetical protein LX32DRAFT_206326 [Colletotrichum zoysiae]|uniref:Uncharacterized protein n=1 Tax=Colletotrichum zoysiae TaxID=1216348 RepID=A0AAD9H5G6_9PEZI|nr:hypothetical protein LX32DRAFT_206326 [Colletotrichum zoysiae]
MDGTGPHPHLHHPHRHRARPHTHTHTHPIHPSRSPALSQISFILARSLHPPQSIHPRTHDFFPFPPLPSFLPPSNNPSSPFPIPFSSPPPIWMLIAYCCMLIACC